MDEILRSAQNDRVGSAQNGRATRNKRLWKRITELRPVIRNAACNLAWQYDEDADEIADRMMIALAEKAKRMPHLLDKPDPYLVQVAKNAIHSDYRHIYGYRLQRHVVSLDDAEMFHADDDIDDDVEREERAEMVRAVIERMDDQERELVRAILANADLIRNAKRRSDRPCRNMINVNALARRLGKSSTSMYAAIAALRLELAPALAIA